LSKYSPIEKFVTLFMKQTIRALLWGMLGTLLFTVVYASAKLTGGEISVFQIMFLRYVSGFTTLALIVAFGKHSIRHYSSNRPHYHLYRSICGAMGGVCFIHASQISPIADVTALGLTDGLLTVLLSAVFLGEMVGIKQWSGALLCGLGALVVVYGSSEAGLFSDFSLGLWLALTGAFLIAVESILIKVLTSKERAMPILLHVNFFSILIMVIPAIYSWKTPDLYQLGFFILLGPIAITAQYCWVIAYRLEDVSVVTPINYTWIIFAAILGYTFFGEPLGTYTIFGSILIALGGIVLSRSSKREVAVQ
jgi:drug/metabolite transporter (DMT)-like permease